MYKFTATLYDFGIPKIVVNNLCNIPCKMQAVQWQSNKYCGGEPNISPTHPEDLLVAPYNKQLMDMGGYVCHCLW